MRVTWFSMYLLDLEGHVEKTSNPFGDRARREKTGEARIYNFLLVQMWIMQKRWRLGHYERPCPTGTPGRMRIRMLKATGKDGAGIRVLQMRNSPRFT